MRNMSFMLTTEQIRNKTKTVTRRLGWKFLKPGDLVMACEKCMGLKKGEKIQRLGVLRVVDVSRVPLSPISKIEVTKEGFPEESPDGFIAMFIQHMKCQRDTLVTRIEFEYLYQCRICGVFQDRQCLTPEPSLAFPSYVCKSCQNDYDSGLYDYQEPEPCERCHGSGVIITCLDDMCHGTGRCIHGDGEDICPDCGGEGEMYV